jgi:hypothetical protein
MYDVEGVDNTHTILAKEGVLVVVLGQVKGFAALDGRIKNLTIFA